MFCGWMFFFSFSRISAFFFLKGKKTRVYDSLRRHVTAGKATDLKAVQSAVQLEVNRQVKPSGVNSPEIFGLSELIRPREA